ncbi:MAG: TrkH family potassium uptake protein [Maricaulaceae bacterium]
MRDVRPVILVIGVMLAGLGVAMLAPMAADFFVGSPDWRSFAATGALTMSVGMAMMISARGSTAVLTTRAAFLMTSLSWVILAAFGAIPFLTSNIGLSVGEAFFESMSGLTTTGATVITGLDTKPPGLLLWRALLQWIGGIGIILTAIAVLPMLQVGGMELFRVESSDTSDKILPRAGEIAGFVGLVYVALTLACAVSYDLLGMTPFEAITHAMTTLSAGGFSTSDASMGAFTPGGADIAADFFMMTAALPFTIYIFVLRRDLRRLIEDSQTTGYIALAAFLVGAMTLYLIGSHQYGALSALRLSAFNVVSVLTGTGYATTDYSAWGPFAVAAIFCITFLGGCAGSAACGIKMFRIQVAFVAMRALLQKMMRPHRVARMRYSGRAIPEAAVYAVLSFLFLYFGAWAVSTLALSVIGIDPTTAMSASATSLANVGPGLGAIIGPAGTFAPLPDPAKWVLAGTMLLGRLEILSVLVMFTPTFWRS